MFEKLFRRELPEEEKEAVLRHICYVAFDKEVSGPAIHSAFQAMQKENKDKEFGFTNNRLLNIVKDMANMHVTLVDQLLYGGTEETKIGIETEIRAIRDSLSEEEQKG